MGTVLALTFAEIVVRIAIPVRNVGPSFTEFDPSDGRRMKRSFHCERITPEFDMKLTTNSTGERGPERDPTADATILCLGDSFTLGYGVDDGEEFPRLVAAGLRKAIPSVRFDVVNAGMGGAGNGRWLHELERDHFAAPLRLVVMQVCGNDFLDNAREALFRVDDRGELISTGTQSRRWYDAVQDVTEPIPGLAYSRLFCLVKQLATRHWLMSAPDLDVGSEDAPVDERARQEDRLTNAILTRALELCAAKHVPVVGMGCALRGRRRELVRSLFAEHGAPLVVPPSKAEAPELYYRVDGHWRPAGHRQAAAMLLETLAGTPFDQALRGAASHH